MKTQITLLAALLFMTVALFGQNGTTYTVHFPSDVYVHSLTAVAYNDGQLPLVYAGSGDVKVRVKADEEFNLIVIDAKTLKTGTLLIYPTEGVRRYTTPIVWDGRDTVIVGEVIEASK